MSLHTPLTPGQSQIKGNAANNNMQAKRFTITHKLDPCGEVKTFFSVYCHVECQILEFREWDVSPWET